MCAKRDTCVSHSANNGRNDFGCRFWLSSYVTSIPESIPCLFLQCALQSGLCLKGGGGGAGPRGFKGLGGRAVDPPPYQPSFVSTLSDSSAEANTVNSGIAFHKTNMQ